MRTGLVLAAIIGLAACSTDKTVGQNVGHDANATGNAINRGANATGNAIGNAADTTGRALNNAGTATRDTLDPPRVPAARTNRTTNSY